MRIFICGVNRSGEEARVLASNPWAWVLFSVLMSRRVDLVWRWFSFLSKSFLLGSLVYLCKRTNTPLLLPRTAQREGEGGGGGGLRTLTFFEEKLVLLSMLPSPCFVDWSLCVRHWSSPRPPQLKHLLLGPLEQPRRSKTANILSIWFNFWIDKNVQ